MRKASWLVCLVALVVLGCAAPVRTHMAPASPPKAIALEDPVFYRDFKYRGGQYRLIERLPAYTESDAPVFVPFLKQELTKALTDSGLPVTTDPNSTPYRLRLYVVTPPYFMGSTWVALFAQVVVRRERLASQGDSPPVGGAQLVAESVFGYSPGIFSDRSGIWARGAIKRLAEALARGLQGGEAQADQGVYIVIPPDGEASHRLPR